MKFAAAFFSGLLFAVGLVISGMTLPANIIGFLDFFGEWKPALAFVMAGAVGVYAALARLIMKRPAPLFDSAFENPSSRNFKGSSPLRGEARWGRLIMGAVIFGIGWALAGFCPGPALTALGAGAREALLFTLAMIAGIFTYRILNRKEPPSENASCG